MAKCARRSSTLAVRLLLLLSSIYDEIRRRGISDAGGTTTRINDESTTFSCSSATVFGLLTVDCTAQNVSSINQLRPTRPDEVKLLRLADNRLARLGPDEFGRVVPHLQQLYLARNFIADVDEHTFRNLRTIEVSVQVLYKTQNCVYEYCQLAFEETSNIQTNSLVKFLRISDMPVR